MYKLLASHSDSFHYTVVGVRVLVIRHSGFILCTPHTSLTSSDLVHRLFFKMSATEQDSSPRKHRVYFCRPCGHRHPSPTNAKCERQRTEVEIHGQPDQTSDNEGPTPVQPAKRRRCSRSTAGGSSRTRSGKQRVMTGNEARAKGTVGTPSNRHKRGHSPSMDESSTGHVSPDEQSNENPVQEPTLALVLKRLDTIAGEGRSERALMEKESRAEREQLRSALASMNSKQRALDNADSAKRVVDILSDEEYTPPTPGPSRSASATATSATGSGHRLTARDLEATANPIQRLRDDRSSRGQPTVSFGG